jgi:excisionase family DNA binding protein
MSISIGDMVLYDTRELADLLGVQEKTVRIYLNNGSLKGRKLGRKWYVPAETLQDYFSGDEKEA